VVHRFSEDGKRPCRSRALSHVVIPVGRNEHDWDLETPRRQLLLHLRPLISGIVKSRITHPTPSSRLDRGNSSPDANASIWNAKVLRHGWSASRKPSSLSTTATRVTLANRSRTGRATSLPDSIARLTAYLRQEAI